MVEIISYVISINNIISFSHQIEQEANQSGEKFQAVRNAAQECGATNGTGRAAMRGFFHGQLQEASACFMFCVMEKLELVGFICENKSQNQNQLINQIQHLLNRYLKVLMALILMPTR